MELMIIAIVSVVFGVLVGVWAMQNRQKMLQNQVENLQSQMQHVKDEAQEKLETVLAEKDKACENMIEAKDKACNNLIDAQEKRHQETDGLHAAATRQVGRIDAPSSGVSGRTGSKQADRDHFLFRHEGPEIQSRSATDHRRSGLP